MSRTQSGPVDIVLATINARQAHCALSLHALQAGLGPLGARSVCLELDTDALPVQAAERILACRPRIVGLSVYLWNVERLVAVMRLLRRIAPGVRLVTGGPQIQEDRVACDEVGLADVAIIGEGERAFHDVCAAWLAGGSPPPGLWRAAPSAPPAMLDARYSDNDCRHRVVYVESSRGCPYRCSYCVSCGDAPVRLAGVEEVLASVDRLMARGVRTIRFLDRSFNALGDHALRVLDGLLLRQRSGVQFHFECVPHAFPEPLRDRLRRFAPGALHLEVGVQTLHMPTALAIGRPFPDAEVCEGVRFLAEETGADLHVDLIAGLPGEGLGTFCDGVDRLLAFGPGELQLGLLKGLPGTPLRRRPPHGFLFSDSPPYEILTTDVLSFAQTRELARLGHVWRLLQERYDRGGDMRELLQRGASPARRVLALSQALQAACGRCHALGKARVLDAWDTLRVLPQDPVGIEGS